MTDAATLSPELSRGARALARALVTAARSWTLYPPDHPFRPQVKILLDHVGAPHETPMLVNTWGPDARGEFRYAVVEAVDPDAV